MNGASRWRRGPVEVVDLGVGLAILDPAHAVLVDCGDGLAAAWAKAGLPPRGPDVILFTGGAAQRIAGLYGLLAAVEGRSGPLRLTHVFGEPRPSTLAEAWLLNEPTSTLELEVEAIHPGDAVHLGSARLQSISASTQEVLWRVELAGVVVLAARGEVDPARMERAGRDADLSVRLGPV